MRETTKKNNIMPIQPAPHQQSTTCTGYGEKWKFRSRAKMLMSRSGDNGRTVTHASMTTTTTIYV